jgi:protein-L-isoaspartate(D-aspartate) O-methyltransferase
VTEPDDRWGDERERMVARQIEARGLRSERVLAAMRSVPRHRFVPPGREGEAHEDHPLPIGEGQTISQPYIVAEMTALALSATPPVRRALDVGTGSGYQAAVLAEAGLEVVSIERLSALADRARTVLAETGYGRVDVRVGDGTLGCADAAPFCCIVVGAAAPEVPAALVEQLREGGVLVVPVGSRSLQDLVVVRRTADGAIRESAGACVFVPLVGEQGWER